MKPNALCCSTPPTLAQPDNNEGIDYVLVTAEVEGHLQSLSSEQREDFLSSTPHQVGGGGIDTQIELKDLRKIGENGGPVTKRVVRDDVGPSTSRGFARRGTEDLEDIIVTPRGVGYNRVPLRRNPRNGGILESQDSQPSQISQTSNYSKSSKKSRTSEFSEQSETQTSRASEEEKCWWECKFETICHGFQGFLGCYCLVNGVLFMFFPDEATKYGLFTEALASNFTIVLLYGLFWFALMIFACVLFFVQNKEMFKRELLFMSVFLFTLFMVELFYSMISSESTATKVLLVIGVRVVVGTICFFLWLHIDNPTCRKGTYANSDRASVLS